jgi:hypothetical protein
MKNSTHYITNTCFVKKFNSGVDDEEFDYHYDKNSRFIKVLEDSDWLFQFTGEQPKKMIKGTVIHVSRLVQHKMIQGTTNLTVQVLEVL